RLLRGRQSEDPEQRPDNRSGSRRTRIHPWSSGRRRTRKRTAWRYRTRREGQDSGLRKPGPHRSEKPVADPQALSKRRPTSMKGKVVTNRKFFTFVSLFVVCAFAAAPTTSQAACTAPACPHVYENGVKTAEAKKVRYLAWGVLEWKNATLDFECHNILA